MKHLLLSTAALAVMTLSAGAVQAGNTASDTADITVTVVSNIAVTNDTALDFGSFTVESPGFVNSDGGGTISGGTFTPAGSSAPSNAFFTVTGEDGFAYDVQLAPTNVSVIASNDTVLSVVGGTTGRTLASGTDTLQISGVLTFAGTVTPQNYDIEDAFNVTVTYQ